ncbi:MAG TPA: SDR family NAD(P)-dependent oxidoreductase [Ilumatobacteraceae bacterium]|nr:SDR family NAD(P)-dependent oxidoreductase [Ilumatobacteraceae bacterium]
MESFTGKIAVVTGGASGMGRELVRQLAAEGCHVATCDLSIEEMEETKRLALADAAEGTVVTTHRCDVSDETSLQALRDAVVDQHHTDHVNLLFNNAGIGGGGSMVTDARATWERTFDVCWGGVYLGVRTFLPLLIAADEGHIVNTSSVNGFWASIGPDRPHTAYSAAKFAVKGFSEALITDLRVNAPHVKVSVVMPGHIGTSIVENSLRHGAHEIDMQAAEMVKLMSDMFRDQAPMTAAEAATEILDAVRAGRWRILVGDDARKLDQAVRANPEIAYESLTLGDLTSSNPGTPFAADG